MACAARFGGKRGSSVFRTCLIYSDLPRSARLQCAPDFPVILRSNATKDLLSQHRRFFVAALLRMTYLEVKFRFDGELLWRGSA